MALDKKPFEIENPKGLADPRENGYSHMATVALLFKQHNHLSSI